MDIINLSILDIGKYNSGETHLHHFGYLSSFYSYIISRSLFGYLNAGVSRMMGYTRELKSIEVMDETIATRSSKPRFIYFHSLICHDPYYFDKQGNVVSRGWSNRNDLTSYRNQIAFANKSITYLVQQIVTIDPNSITIVMSDHGFRFLDGLTDDERIKESFSNFCAIRFPDGNYATLNDSISAVNVMRIVLNKAFSLNLEHLENECFSPIYE